MHELIRIARAFGEGPASWAAFMLSRVASLKLPATGVNSR